MHKRFMLLAVAVAIFVVTACGGSNESSEPEPKAAEKSVETSGELATLSPEPAEVEESNEPTATPTVTVETPAEDSESLSDIQTEGVDEFGGLRLYPELGFAEDLVEEGEDDGTYVCPSEHTIGAKLIPGGTATINGQLVHSEMTGVNLVVEFEEPGVRGVSSVIVNNTFPVDASKAQMLDVKKLEFANVDYGGPIRSVILCVR